MPNTPSSETQLKRCPTCERPRLRSSLNCNVDCPDRFHDPVIASEAAVKRVREMRDMLAGPQNAPHRSPGAWEDAAALSAVLAALASAQEMIEEVERLQGVLLIADELVSVASTEGIGTENEPPGFTDDLTQAAADYLTARTSLTKSSATSQSCTCSPAISHPSITLHDLGCPMRTPSPPLNSAKDVG